MTGFGCLIEDDEDDYHLTLELLREARGDFSLEWVSTYHGALEEIEESRHDIYLVDYRLGERDGLELVRTAIVMGCKSPLIILTGVGDHNVGAWFSLRPLDTIIRE